MAPGGTKPDPGEVHIGPSSQSRPTAAVPASRTSCCSGTAHVVALTRDDAGGRVELIRCAGCGGNTWRLGGAQVPRERALAELSAVFTEAGSRRVRPSGTRRQPVPATAAEAVVLPRSELADLLAGWQVLGAR